MQTVDMQTAKTNLLRLVDAAAAGEEIIIARAGKPVARLIPLATQPPKVKRILGLMAGQMSVSDDFDAPLPDDLLKAFEGRSR